MKLVVYYSRTGNTKRIGEKIAKKIKADTDEIIDLKNREGFFGFISAIFDSVFKRKTQIKFKKNPAKYDLVVLGGPVWAGGLSPALRTYVDKNRFKKIGFFCSCGDKDVKGFHEIELLARKPIAKLEVSDNEDLKINKFCKELK